MSDITMYSIAELSKKLKEREISSVELVDACIKRTDQLQGKLNPYITLLADQAKSDAVQAQAEIDKSGPRSPLHGIPIALKDNFYTKGVLTTAASGILKDFKPDYDATITARLSKAGAVLMGKTGMHEWAFGPTNEFSYFGPIRNPWDPERICGGSSGGSAVAVATGMACMAMGTDTGGSVRIPAGFCGVVGFKPSYGLASLHGIIPLSLTADHPGPITRSVMDAAITMDMITGHDPDDPCPNRRINSPTNYAERIENADNLKGCLLGVPKNYFFDTTDYPVEELFKETVKRLEALGASIKYLWIPHLQEVPNVATVIVSSEAACYHKKYLAECPEAYQPPVLERIKTGVNFRATEYIQAMMDRKKIADAWEEAARGLDAVIAPTLPVTAFKIGSSTVVTRGREEAAVPLCLNHNRVANITRGPALSVPNGMIDGLPTGLMIMGLNGCDKRVLEIGHVFEKHYPYKLLQY